MRFPISTQGRTFGLVLVAGVVLSSCQGPRGRMEARATEEWTRSYPLAANGELVIGNPSGSIEVQGVEGTTVDIRAELSVRAVTEEAAREVLPRIAIKESATPAKIVIQTEGLGGIVIGVDVEVAYHVRAPRTTTVRLRAGGPVKVSGFAGRVVVNTRNGGITGDGLSGGVEARTTNGDTRIELESLGADLVDLRTTNGHIQLTIPRASDANLLATLTNGRIDLGDLKFEPLGEQTRRRVRGRLNSGGTPIELATTNGNIRVGAPGLEPFGAGPR